MKRLYTALLAAGLGLGTVVAAPSAAAAPTQCQYVARDLPLPAGATGSRVWSSSSDDKLVLGEVYGITNQHGVIWRDGKIWQVVYAPDLIRVDPMAVNKNGVVVGAMSDTRSTTASAC